MFYVAKSIDADGLNNIDGFAIEIIDLSKINEILSKTSYGEGKGYLSVTDGTGCVLNYEGNAVQKIDDIADSGIRDVMKSTVKPTSAENNIDYNVGGKLGCYNYFTGASSLNWKWVSVYPANMARYYGGSCRYMRTSRYSHHKVYRKPDERDGKGCP